MEEQIIKGKIININGPVIKARGMEGVSMLDIAEVGPHGLIGEVIRLENDIAIVQVYEDNTGLKPGDEVRSSRRPLSVLLGPGLISSIYDGIQRPLDSIEKISGSFITRGIKVSPLEKEKKWHFIPLVKKGNTLKP